MKEPAIKAVAVAGLLLLTLLGVSCSSGRSFDREVETIVKPYRFNVVTWEIKALFGSESGDFGSSGEVAESGVSRVTEYFAHASQINAVKSEIGSNGGGAGREAELERMEKQQAARQGTVQRIMEQQIRETLAEQGIYHPWYRNIKLKVNLPPPYFKLERPPNILIVSPRDRIETRKTVLLRNDISLANMAEIESAVDKLNVSSLVEGLGGLGSTYPALVTSDASLEFILDTAVHEWVHQYLFFTPLGFRYALDRLGFSRNPDIATMNETVAGIVGKEISRAIRQKYYPGYRRPYTVQPGIDFSAEMREIRKTVDQYLAQGEIERAETYMEQKRQYLVANGYYIRKLNQAYFAFHGGYADVPAFLNPIGEELKKLRSQKALVSDFLDTVAAMSSRQDLKLAVGEALK